VGGIATVALRRILAGIFLLFLIAIAGGLIWLRTSLPETEGRIALSGLAARVEIRRDAHGIPTITAANDRDAVFALGFVHAQDRLFQMDAMRHYGAGRLSEWLGAATVPTDRFTRTLGIYRLAEQQYALLSPELRAELDAYAAGVNAYLAQHRGAWPIEYYLLRAEPEPWRPADTLVWAKLMDLQLAGSFYREVLHARLAQRLKPPELAVLYPPYPGDAPVTLGDVAALRGLPLDALYAALPADAAPVYASNNWVVDGKHTQSGKPLLANDPHLGLSAPSVWYLARMETPDASLAGVTSPGGPFVVLGHNAHIAWGFTTTESAVADLFIEKIDPSDKTRYETPEGPQPFIIRREQIVVRGADPVTVDVRATRHGPVISDLGGNYGKVATDQTVLALRATWLDADDRTPDAAWALNHAKNWQEFRGGLKDFAAPQQNMVYADVDGNIGFIAPARVPIRAKGDGWLPAPGWSGAYDWTGYIPFDRLPQALNPPSGRFVSANNKIVPDSYPYFLSRDWDLPNRAERITALLDATPVQSPDATAAIQADILSPMAKDLLPLLLETTPASPRAAAVLGRLKAWDGRMARDEAAPLLFAAWLRELNRVLLAKKLGDAFEDYWGMRPNVVRLILTKHPEWCEQSAEAPPSCAEALSRSLEQALDDLTQRYGAEMKDWRWGRAHEAAFTNQLLSRVPGLRGIFATRIAADGGDDTLNRAAALNRDEAEPFADIHGPTLRMIVDLSDIAATRFMIAPGQSGNPLSPHYGDLMGPWREAAYLTLDGGAAEGTLELAPAP
jgi:penicillin G amidase